MTVSPTHGKCVNMLKHALLFRDSSPPLPARGANWRSLLEPADTSATDADTAAKFAESSHTERTVH